MKKGIAIGKRNSRDKKEISEWKKDERVKERVKRKICKT